jgi:uncharacterized membrane protein
MLTIAGGIILAIILLFVFGALIVAMFSGFAKSARLGCFTMVAFGIILFVLATCVFGSPLEKGKYGQSRRRLSSGPQLR